MFKKFYIYMLLIIITFTTSCSYSGEEDPGDTFRVLAASNEWYFVVLGGNVTVELPSGQIYGYDVTNKKLIIGHYVDSIDYTKAIYANGYHEESQTYFNYFGVEIILDENDDQQAIGMKLYYNDGEYYYNQTDVEFIEENRATNLKGINVELANTMSNDKYMENTGLSATVTNSGTLYSIATITDSDNRSIIKGYTLVNGSWRDEEIDNSTALPAPARKTTGYHSVAPLGDNATMTYIKDDEKIEVYELNKTVKGRTLTEGNGLGINAIYSTIATNKAQDIFVAYVDIDDNLSMFKKDNGTVDEVASFVDYFNGVENVSQPIIKIYDNGTVITSYIDNESKLLKIIVDDFIDNTTLDYVTITPPTDLKVTAFSVDIIDGAIHYIYSTSDNNFAPIGSEVSVYENGLWRIIKTYPIYNNLDFVSIGGVNKKELYFVFHYKYEHQECDGLDNDTECKENVNNIISFDSTDYITLYGSQSYESTISGSPRIGSFITYNNLVYYLYNIVEKFEIATSCSRYFNPMPPSTADGLPTVSVEDNLDIDMFELVNNTTTDINNGLSISVDSGGDSDLIFVNKCFG